MIHRYQKAVGLTVWRWGRSQWILWFCPKGQDIVPHVHNKLDASITWLGGTMHWMMGSRDRLMRWKDLFKTVNVPRGTIHGAQSFGIGLFMVKETWQAGVSVTSAAVDFESV